MDPRDGVNGPPDDDTVARLERFVTGLTAAMTENGYLLDPHRFESVWNLGAGLLLPIRVLETLFDDPELVRLLVEDGFCELLRRVGVDDGGEVLEGLRRYFTGRPYLDHVPVYRGLAHWLLHGHWDDDDEHLAAYESTPLRFLLRGALLGHLIVAAYLLAEEVVEQTARTFRGPGGESIDRYLEIRAALHDLFGEPPSRSW